MIERSLKRRALTRIDRERVARDLDLITTRVRGREYRFSSFQSKQSLAIPERTEEFFNELSYFHSLGTIWLNIFQSCRAPRRATLLDVGCGYYPKVEMGLYYYGFKGTVELLDLDRRALSFSQRFLTFFDCAFQARSRHQNLWRMPAGSYQAVVGNHLLDDLILEVAADWIQTPLATLYSEETRYLKTWREVEARFSELLGFAQRFAVKIRSLLAPGGLVLLLDYPSFSHRALQASLIPRVVGRFQRVLRTALVDVGFRPVEPMEERKLQHGMFKLRRSHLIAYRRG